MRVVGRVRIYHLSPEEFKKMHEDYVKSLKEASENEPSYPPTKLDTATIKIVSKRD